MSVAVKKVYDPTRELELVESTVSRQGNYCLVRTSDGEIPRWCQPQVDRWGDRNARHMFCLMYEMDGDDRRIHYAHSNEYVWHLPEYELVKYPRGVHEVWQTRDNRQMMVSMMATVHVERAMMHLEREILRVKRVVGNPARHRNEERRIGLWIRRFDQELARRQLTSTGVVR